METHILNKKKIFWLVPHLNLWQGGYRYLADLCGYLTTHFDITVGYASGRKDLINYINQKNVSTQQVNLIGTNTILYWLLSPILIPLELLLTYYRSRKSDLLIGSLFPSIFILALCAKLQKKPFIHFCFVPYPWFYDKKFIAEHPLYLQYAFKLLKFVYEPFDRWAITAASNTITIDHFSAQQIKTIYQKDPHEISIGIDTHHFHPITTALNKIMNTYKGKTIFFHCTDYSLLKNTSAVLEAFSKISFLKSDYILLISTTRPNVPEEQFYKNLAEKLGISKRVKFLGLVDYDLLPHYYSSAACYISLAENTAMSNVNLPVKEALACGTPAIRTATVITDVENTKSGFIVALSQPEQIRQKIELFMKNPNLKKHMGPIGRSYIEKHYSWNAVSRKFTDALLAPIR